MNRSESFFALRHAADRRAIGFALAHFLLVVASIALWQRGAPELVFIPLIACSAFIQLISTHNAMHSPVFRQRRMNRLWQCVLSCGIGYPCSVFVPVHNLSHHLHLQTAKDVLRTTEMRHRWNLLNLLHHMLSGTVHLHLLHAAYLDTMRRTHPRWFAQVVVEALAVAAMFGGVSLLAGPYAALVLVLVPCVMGQLLIVGFGYVQHDGCDPESEHAHSRNFTGPLFNWFIMDNGYHTVHHDQPHTHWSEGKAAHARVLPLMHPALTQRSLLAYLVRTFVRAGGRLRYDGTPVVHTAPLQTRELWTPERAPVSMGAVDAAEAPRPTSLRESGVALA